MTQRSDLDERLNAYVDGELAAEDAARMADAAADDPVLARRIATLTHLKHATAAGLAPQRPAPAERQSGRRRAWGWQGAAALLALAVISVTVATWLTHTELGPTDGWQSQLLQVHARMSEAPLKPVDNSAVLLAALPTLGPRAIAPDLRAAKLRVGGVMAVEPFADARAVAIGYYGTRGCRLTVLITDAATGLDASMRQLATPTTTVYGWRLDQLSYLVLASGMDSKRLATIASSVHWSSVNATRPDERVRTALRRSRDRSAPCARA